MSARTSLNASSILSEPRYAVTDALGLGWLGQDNQRGDAFGGNAGAQPVVLPVCLTNRIPSHTARVLSP